MQKSSKKTLIDLPKKGWKTKFVNLVKVPGAFVRPNGITQYAKHPHGVMNVVLCWSSSAI